MNIAIVAIMFLAIWGWLAYEIYYAPEYDENEMPVNKKKDDKYDWVDRVFKKDDNDDVK